MSGDRNKQLVHLGAEAVAVGAVAPWLARLSADPDLTPAQQKGAEVLAVATVVLDGVLMIATASRLAGGK